MRKNALANTRLNILDVESQRDLGKAVEQDQKFGPEASSGRLQQEALRGRANQHR